MTFPVLSSHIWFLNPYEDVIRFLKPRQVSLKLSEEKSTLKMGGEREPSPKPFPIP